MGKWMVNFWSLYMSQLFYILPSHFIDSWLGIENHYPEEFGRYFLEYFEANLRYFIHKLFDMSLKIRT